MLHSCDRGSLCFVPRDHLAVLICVILWCSNIPVTSIVFVSNSYDKVFVINSLRDRYNVRDEQCELPGCILHTRLCPGRAVSYFHRSTLFILTANKFKKERK